jgi:hypothetical protein
MTCINASIERGRVRTGRCGVWSVETVLVCALALLGRSERTFPPVEFVDHAPFGVSASAQAYVHGPDARITLITSTEAFTNARRTLYPCTDVAAIREIAGVLAHEEWHVRHGPDEESAYNADDDAAGGRCPPGQLVVSEDLEIEIGGSRRVEAQCTRPYVGARQQITERTRKK